MQHIYSQVLGIIIAIKWGRNFSDVLHFTPSIR
jgi:hypothetical protein